MTLPFSGRCQGEIYLLYPTPKSYFLPPLYHSLVVPHPALNDQTWRLRQWNAVLWACPIVGVDRYASITLLPLPLEAFQDPSVENHAVNTQARFKIRNWNKAFATEGGWIWDLSTSSSPLIEVLHQPSIWYRILITHEPSMLWKKFRSWDFFSWFFDSKSYSSRSGMSSLYLLLSGIGLVWRMKYINLTQCHSPLKDRTKDSHSPEGNTSKNYGPEYSCQHAYEDSMRITR